MSGADGQKRVDVVDVAQLLKAGRPAYDRLPMAEVVFDRLCRTLTGSLRNQIQNTVDVHLAELASKRFDEARGAIETPGLFALVRAREWDNLAMIGIGQPTLLAFVEVMLGGRGAEAREATSGLPRVEGGDADAPARPITAIERNLAERLVRLVLADLSTSFAPLCAVSFDLERIETDPRFAVIGRGSGAVLAARLEIRIGRRAGLIDVLLPHATLEPVREILLQQFMGEKFGRDAIWETHLVTELAHTDVVLEAVLDQKTLPLGRILGMQPGDVVPLDADRSLAILLRCGDRALFAGRLGMRRGRVAVEIGERLPMSTEDPPSAGLPEAPALFSELSR